MLSNLVPRLCPDDLQGSIRRNIIEPAADLAHQLHLASNIYSLKWPVRTAPTRLEVYECLDLASNGRPLNLSGTTQSSPSRQQTSYLFDVAPGLFVERIEGGKKMSLKVICRPTVLVHGDEGEIAQKPTVTSWLWEHSGLPRGPQRTTIRKSKTREPNRLSKL